MSKFDGWFERQLEVDYPFDSEVRPWTVLHMKRAKLAWDASHNATIDEVVEVLKRLFDYRIADRIERMR